MKVGLDLDGTILGARLEPLFALLSRAIVEHGGEVHVITYREQSHADLRAELDALSITYTDCHLPPRGVDAPAWKRQVAERLDLDVFFEDSPEVLAELPESIQRVWVADPEVFDMRAALDGLRNG
ncbi:MAG: hypothetical protein H6834_17770 [Planctomycetes bacterium]|nr:hypothetical protein [Planctomycetota bacterium]